MKTFNEDDVRFTYRLLGHQHETEIRLIDPTKEKFPQSIFVHSEDEFVDVCRLHNGTYNVYAGINERVLGGTTAEKVMTVNVFVIDIDAVRVEPGLTPAEITMLAASEHELLLASFVANSIFMDLYRKEYSIYMAESGNGRQIWIPLPQTRATEQLEANIVYLQRQTQTKYKSDRVTIDNMGDLARVMRVIGTLNTKGNNPESGEDEQEKRPRRLSHWHKRTSEYSCVKRCDKALEFIMSLDAPIDPPFIGPQTKSAGARHTRIYVRNHDNGRHLYRGVWDHDKYDSRSEAEFALVCIMILGGFGRDDIDAIMRECAIGKWKTATQAYRDLTYENAIKFSNV